MTNEGECDLAHRSCVPCSGKGQALKGEALASYMAQLGNEWGLVDDHHIVRRFRLRDFQEALTLTNRIGELAEAEGHHPVIELTWGQVGVTLWTHKLDGLSESDFILAAKINALSAE